MHADLYGDIIELQAQCTRCTFYCNYFGYNSNVHKTNKSLGYILKMKFSINIKWFMEWFILFTKQLAKTNHSLISSCDNYQTIH